MFNAMSWMYFGWLVSQSICLVLLFYMQHKIKKGEVYHKMIHVLCVVFCVVAFVFIGAILIKA